MKRWIHASNDSESLVEQVQKFINTKNHKFKKFEKGKTLYIEKHSLQSMYNDYIKYFNENVKEYGNGFETDWHPDDWMSILYKDGTIRYVNPEEDDGTKKIKTDGIDSIIVDGSWGTACAGNHLIAEDYTQYEDIPDIRIEFDI